MIETNETRKEQAVDAIERLVAEYIDVLAPGAKLPILADWCLVAAHNDAADPEHVYLYRLNRRHQPDYRSVGLLQVALNDYQSESEDEDDDD